MMHSIRVKITAITIVAILTSMLSVFVACYSTLQAENDRKAMEMMRLTGQNTQKTLDRYFESIEQSVEMVANIAADSLDSVTLVECGVTGSAQAERTPGQVARLDAYLARYTADIQKAFESVASHTTGVVTYYYCFSPDISRTEHGFFYSRVGKTGFDEQPPLDARELDPEDTAHTTWYYTPIQRGRPSWVGPYTAHFLGEMLIGSYLVPIYRAGAFIGVLGMDIPLDTLIEQVSALRVYRTGYACLFDEQGRVVYHPRLPYGSAPEQMGVPGFEDMLLREDSVDTPIRYSAEGEDRQLLFFTLSNGMKLAMVAPANEIDPAWARLARICLIVTAAVIAVYTVLLLFVMRLITRPLQRLTVASQRLADGDYDVRLDYRGRDEVGQLTGAFTRMRDQQKQYFEDLNRRIYTDALTGLPNMRCFYRLAMDRRRELIEAGKCPAMLFFNLIGMKQYNRQHGFDEGDRLICEVGAILKRRFGDKSMGHFGQDHFAAVTDEDSVEPLLRDIFRELRNANGGRSLPVRVGVYPNRLEDVDVSVACDRAKLASDRHRDGFASGVSWFDAPMLERGERYRYIINNLDRALAEGWVRVYYQPIVRAANGRVCDEEALARWIDPVQGFMSPGDFIPALEDAKLIYRLDLYVLEQILEKLKRQAEAGLYVVPQSLNLSRADFDSCDIVEEIRRRVDDSGIDRSMLTIEITESVVGSDFDFIKAQVARFQQLGFQTRSVCPFRCAR